MDEQELRNAASPGPGATSSTRGRPVSPRTVWGRIAAWPPGVLAGLLAGAGFAGGLMLYHRRVVGGDPDVQTFTGTVQYTFWAAVIALEIGLWGALLPGLLRMNLRLRHELGKQHSRRGWSWLRWRGWLGWQDGGFLALLFLLVAALLVVGSTGQPIPDAVGWRTRAVTWLGLLVGGPIFTGVWLLQETVTKCGARLAAAVRDLNDAGEVAWEPTGKELFDAVISKRAVLQQLLLAASLIIGAATLATGALRLAVLAADPTASFPVAYPLLYGGFFTVVLAFIYVPAYLSLQRVGASLLDACWPVPPTKPDKAWHEDRQAASAALGLTVSVRDSFQAGAAVLAPLATSVVTVLLPD